MSLYAIGDLHLRRAASPLGHYQSVLRAPGQLHDRGWRNHEEKFRKNCGKMITDEDTLVLVGDHFRARCASSSRTAHEMDARDMDTGSLDEALDALDKVNSDEVGREGGLGRDAIDIMEDTDAEWEMD